jgi:hypothetical protein
MDSNEKQRERELARRRDQERKDLETERTAGPRPLEGLSGAGTTTWTDQQDDAPAAEEHGADEERARQRSERQISRER